MVDQSIVRQMKMPEYEKKKHNFLAKNCKNSFFLDVFFNYKKKKSVFFTLQKAAKTNNCCYTSEVK